MPLPSELPDNIRMQLQEAERLRRERSAAIWASVFSSAKQPKKDT